MNADRDKHHDANLATNGVEVEHPTMQGGLAELEGGRQVRAKSLGVVVLLLLASASATWALGQTNTPFAPFQGNISSKNLEFFCDAPAEKSSRMMFPLKGESVHVAGSLTTKTSYRGDGMATAVVGFLSQDKKESLYLRLVEVDKNGNRMNIFAENNGSRHAMRQIAGSVFLGQEINFDVARTSSGVQLMLNGKIIGTGINGPIDGYLVLACSSGESDFKNITLD